MRTSPTPAGLRFTERMTGWCARGAASCEEGRATGVQQASPISFEVTITVPDVDAVCADPAVVAHVQGYVEAPALFAGRAPIQHGEFQLMVKCPDEVRTSNMRYEIDFAAPDGQQLHLSGFKVLHHEPIWRLWPATTTLHVTVSKSFGGAGPVLARGIMVIKPLAFLRQLTTFRATPKFRWWRAARTIARFAKGFVGRLAPLYAGELNESDRFARPLLVPHRPLRLPAPTTQWCDAGGTWHEGGKLGTDATLRLTNYRGGTKGPLLMAPGFGMEAHAFAVPTIDCTLAEFAVDHGYDVWLFDYRASIALPTAKTSFTIDDIATQDWPRAVARVREVTGAGSVQILGHCVGSVSVLMAMLAGLQGVRSLVCSQYQVYMETSWFNRLKNLLHVTAVLRWLHVRAIRPDQDRTRLNKLLDVVLAPLPLPKGERCGKPMCRWINAIYGLTHHHAQLNDATHEALDTAFGFANVRGLSHLALIARKQHAVDSRGGEAYLPHATRLALPILFIQGQKNFIFRPAGLERTLAWLGANNSPTLYDTLDLPHYAHLDTMIGKHASTDVFPHIVAHLDRSNP